MHVPPATNDTWRLPSNYILPNCAADQDSAHSPARKWAKKAEHHLVAREKNNLKLTNKSEQNQHKNMLFAVRKQKHSPWKQND